MWFQQSGCIYLNVGGQYIDFTYLVVDINSIFIINLFYLVRYFLDFFFMIFWIFVCFFFIIYILDGSFVSCVWDMGFLVVYGYCLGLLL